MDNSVREKIDNMASRYPRRQSALLPALHILQQDACGCINSEVFTELAEILGVSAAHIQGVWTFYTMYNKKPVGKYHLQVDGSVPAMLAGADEIINHLEDTLGIKTGQTTNDELFTLTKVEDLGSCGTAPLIQVNNQRYYENMTIDKTDELIASLRKGQWPKWSDERAVGKQTGYPLKGNGL